MMEIVAVETSVSKIRLQFARILVHSAPQDAQALFHQFVMDVCDGDSSDAAVVGIALHAIEGFMNEMGRSLTHKDYGFVLPDFPADNLADASDDVRRVRRRHFHAHSAEMSAQTAIVERDRLLGLLTQEQHAGFNLVMSSINSLRPCNTFSVISSAGCGKTVLANALAATVRANGRVAICVAASALAAMLLDGGTTAHSKFHIPIPANDGTVCYFSSAERELIRRADIVLYDECSMVHSDVADTVERSFQDILRDARPFGGKTIVFMGDFKQLLPVVRYGRGHEHTMQKCAWWRQVTIIKLTLNWRAVNNPEYAAFLELVGSGELAQIKVPPLSRVDNAASLIAAVYGDNNAKQGHQILALTLETCKMINTLCLGRLPGLLHEHYAADTYVDCRDPDGFPTDYVESLEMHGAPPFTLGLKLGARYMCIKNVDAARGIINGTMLELLSIGSRTLQVRVMSGPQKGSVDQLTSCVFTITSDASGLPFSVVRRQYPLIPAYCLSVHKAQGQSLEVVGIVFESDPFAHGQVYVALSRAGGWHRIFVLLRNQEESIRNLVFKHLII